MDDDGSRVERLVDAIIPIAGDLDLPSVLQRIVEAAADLVDARYAALGVVGADGALAEFVYTGVPAHVVAEIGRLPEGRGLLGLLITSPQVLRLDDLQTHAASYGFPDGHPPMRSFLGVPIRTGHRVFGNLYLTEKRTGPFDADDEELTIALAAVAGSAIERVRLTDEVRRSEVVADRERIGRDLHDTVIQRLFAAGLGLQAARPLAEDVPEVADLLDDTVDELDQIIREIRQTIFALQSSRAAGAGLRRDVTAIVDELSATLGLRPRLRFDGPVDLALTAREVDHIVPVLREALTNVAKHADASVVDVRVSVAAGRLLIEVADDGRGHAGEAHRGLGLRNLRARAADLGGTLEVADPQTGGTSVRWQVPIATS